MPHAIPERRPIIGTMMRYVLGSAAVGGLLVIGSCGAGDGGGTTEPPPPPPPPPGLVFNSDWSTATGTSVAAVTDGGKWNAHGFCMLEGDNRVIRVVPASEKGFTRANNIFRVTLQNTPASPGCGQVEWIDGIPASTRHYGRFYYLNDENAMTSVHNWSQNFGVGDPGAIQWVFFNRHGVPGGWTLNIRPVHLGGFYPYNVWTLQSSANFANAIVLQDDVWYRYEWMVEYPQPNRMRIWPRLYNAAGTLIANSDNFYQQDSPALGTLTLTQYYAAGNSFQVASPELARNFGIGNEGRVPGTASGSWYIANFAISLADWIGE